ncbi:NUDIX hydrolase [Limoniibacter endophyticus]|uniref:NUDIX hydrolase n=1 Tax=Limoniibacter endophyticus TaxID=1565040 RepID=A0A8J3DK60_9HYPH|nr:NUDIX hydrolase [Limoniibacter endophyticus]GHC75677.1 NUDIX hydrolase [Limoniibacter endophyticus]
MTTSIMNGLRTLMGIKPPRLQIAALPWRRVGARVEVMLITSRGTGRWVIPKGWPEGLEPLHVSAAREAYEEAGLAGEIAIEAIGSFVYDKRKDSGMANRCQVLVFPLLVQREASSWPEQKQRKRVWMSRERAAESVDERELSELIRAFSPTSETIENAPGV